MVTYTPPGWPAGVHPPGSEDFESTAVGWLLDVVPPDYRLHGVLRRYPVALAAMARYHSRACVEGARQGYRTARTELAGTLPPHAIDTVLAAYRKEGARLAATARAVGLIERALRGEVFTPKMSPAPTARPRTAEPGMTEPRTAEPRTTEPRTAGPGTAEPTTARPQTARHRTAEPQTAEPQTAEPQTAEPQTVRPRATGPQAAKAAAPKMADRKAAATKAAGPEGGQPAARASTARTGAPAGTAVRQRAERQRAARQREAT
jgi:hypothetical protein